MTYGHSCYLYIKNWEANIFSPNDVFKGVKYIWSQKKIIAKKILINTSASI